MVTVDRLTWEQFEPLITRPAAPVSVRLDGTPNIEITFDDQTGQLALLLPAGAASLETSPLAELHISQVSVGGLPRTRLSTKTRSLFPYFFQFAISVADLVQLVGLDPHDAIREGLSRWKDLLRPESGLSSEQQTGLIGELWTLDRLIELHGPTRAITAWTGPTAEAHDFRLATAELEVKTTRSERRQHVISSETQLDPSPGHTLYVVSIQLAAAGNGQGRSLGEWVRHIANRLVDPAALAKFNMLLHNAFDLEPGGADRYADPMMLRTDPHLIEVDSKFPKITLGALATTTDTTRISDVRYRVDVEGLGVGPGSIPFDTYLGKESV